MSGKTDTKKNLKPSNGAAGAGAGVTDETGERWLPAALAQRLTGIPKRTIARFAEENVIERKRSLDGVWLYSLDELEPLAKEDAGKAELERVKNDSLRDAQAHARESFALTHEPTRAIVTFYKEELALARARIAALESGFDANIAARETLLSEAHARTLAERDADRRAARWDQALATLQKVIPPLAMQAMASMGGKSDAPILALISRLDPSRLVSILNVDAMNDDERAVVGELMTLIAEQQKAAATAAPEGTAADGE